MNTGPSGFHNAPVTRSVVIVSAVFTVLAGMRGRSTSLGLSFQDIKKLNLGRLITSLFAFSSTPELLFGLYLLYYFRVFERQIGSNKYSVFILFSLILSMVFQITSLQLLKDSSLSALASGPYGLIFSSFVPFYFDIPVSTRLNIFRVPFSDKSFIYLAGLQLILSSWKRSLLPGICGIFAGLLYRLNIFHVRRLKFPEAVTSIFARISIPFFSGGTPRSNIAPTVENPGNRTERPARHVEANFAPSAPFASLTVPSEDSIATLESMGFDRNSAREALMQARNDVNAATNILLEAQQHS